MVPGFGQRCVRFGIRALLGSTLHNAMRRMGACASPRLSRGFTPSLFYPQYLLFTLLSTPRLTDTPLRVSLPQQHPLPLVRGKWVALVANTLGYPVPTVSHYDQDEK